MSADISTSLCTYSAQVKSLRQRTLRKHTHLLRKTFLGHRSAISGGAPNPGGPTGPENSQCSLFFVFLKSLEGCVIFANGASKANDDIAIQTFSIDGACTCMSTVRGCTRTFYFFHRSRRTSRLKGEHGGLTMLPFVTLARGYRGYGSANNIVACHCQRWQGGIASNIVQH